jgi:hypothetical protein
MTPRQLEQAVRDEPRLGPLIRQFYRAIELQQRRDGETVASLSRVLRSPRSADAEKLVELLRGVLDRKGN